MRTTITEGFFDRRKASGWRVIRRVVPYLWPKEAPGLRVRVVLAMLALVLSKVVTVATPFFFKEAVDVLSGKGASAGAMAGIGAVGLVIAYGMARLMSVGFAQMRDALFVRVAQRALRRLALETFRHIHALSLRYHITRKTGALSRIIERGVKGIEFLMRFMLFNLVPLALELVMVATIFWWVFDLRYLAVVVLTIALYVWFTFRLTEWRVKIRKEMNEQDAEANQKAIDSLLNFETVKYFNAEEWEARRYDAAMAGYESAAVRTGFSLALLNFGQAFIITAGLVAVMVMAALEVEAGRLTVGDFVMVNAYMIQLTMPLNFLGTVYREIRQALVDMGDMFDLLDQKPEIVEKPDAKPLEVREGKVEFDHVRFGYERNRPILKGVSFVVPGGRSLAIVGPSGSGKSTIARLLFRFYDVWEGAIRIDDQDIRDVTLSSLHQAIGIVPQDTVLFNDTIYYNIAYGRPDASREEVEAAAKAAAIHDFITSLPEGYETLVGERGLKLSGGEKQRVGIARTLLKDPPILVLDEATSALDSETEQEIQESLHRLGRGRTVLMIAHRLSTVVDADHIIVLEKGRIVEEGTHEALLAAGGRYAAMWQRQQAAEEDIAEDGALGAAG